MLIELLESRRLLSLDAAALGETDPGLLRVVSGQEASLASQISPRWFQEVIDVPAAEQAVPAAVYGPVRQGEAEQTATADRIRWQGTETQWVPDQWIVRLTPQAAAEVGSPTEAVRLFRDGPFDVRVIRGLGLEGSLLLEIASHGDVPAVADWLGQNANLAYFEPNSVMHVTAVPDDIMFSDQWALDNQGQTGGTVDADIDAPEAWELTTGSRDIVVGVIDTGVDYNHPDLAANMWTNPGEIPGNGVDDDGNGFIDDVHGFDFVNNIGDPVDNQGHGTHVAGILAAVGDNDIGTVGVNWAGSIMALKILQTGGDSTDAMAANAVRALNYATMMRRTYGVDIRLTNNSWGFSEYSQTLYDAIAASRDAGMLFIAGAGNDGRDDDTAPFYPASYDLDNIISVAATNHNDALWSQSNYGATSVDLAAPGENILVTARSGDFYYDGSGTSMATPHVSGVAALAWSYFPEATWQEVRRAILAGVDRVPSLTGKVATGGRLNALGALYNVIMNVGASAPAADAVIADAPTRFTIHFTQPFEPSSVQAADLTVNGIAADTVTLEDSDTATFEFPASPVVAEGLQSMAIPAGSILRSDGVGPIGGWSATFRYDTVTLSVVDTVPAAGTTLTLPFHTLDIDFNEPVKASSVQTGDFVVNQGRVAEAVLIDADTVRLTLSDLVEGTLTLSLAAGAVTDNYDNANVAFGANYVLDFGTVAYPPLTARPPLGSLVYGSAAGGWIGVADDTDAFAIDVDGGQTISVAVTPTEITLQPVVELYDPSNALLDSATGAGAGQSALINSAAAEATGTYRVVVRGATETTGRYSVQLVLNAAWEQEGLVAGANNDAPSTAQDLEPSLVSLGGSASRAAVLGAGASGADGFETADFNALPWVTSGDADWFVTDEDAAAGTYSARAGAITDDQSSSLEVTLTTAAGSVSFARRVSSEEYCDFLYFLIDGTEVASWSGDVAFDMFSYPVTAGRHTFTWQYTKDYSIGEGLDTAYLDEVVLPLADLDFYRLTLTQGQTVSLVLEGESMPPAGCELRDAAGNRLAVSAAVAANADQVVTDFTATAAGTNVYDVVVSANTAYSLTVIRDAAFDLEPNDRLETAPAIVSRQVSGEQRVLGHVGPVPGGLFAINATDGSILELDPANGAVVRTLPAPGTFIATGSESLNLAATDALLYYNAGGTFGDTTIAQLEMDHGSLVGRFAGVGTSYMALAVVGDEVFVKDSDSKVLRVFRADTGVNVRNLPSPIMTGLAGDSPHGRLFGASGWMLYEIDPWTGAILRQTARPQTGVALGMAFFDGELFVSEATITNHAQVINVFDADTFAHVRTLDVSATFAGDGIAGLGGDGLTPRLPADYYRLTVDASAAVLLETSLPAAGPGEFGNGLYPALRLYTAGGSLVASADGNLDGRNSRLSFPAGELAAGTYYVAVAPSTVTPGTQGEYVLRIVGNQPALPPFQVAHSDPADGASFQALPEDFSVRFNDAVLLSTLDPADFAVDGVPSADLTIVDGNTVTIPLPGDLAEGTHAITIAGGAISDVQGTPIDAFRSTLVIDRTPPRVVGTSVAVDEVVAPGSLSYAVTFSEPMYTAGITAADFSLQGLIRDAVYTPQAYGFDSTRTVLTITYANLPDDAYRLTLTSGDLAFEDAAGNDLDGEVPAQGPFPIPPNQSGDGAAGGNFVLHFATDVAPVAYPTPLDAQAPAGGLIHDSSVSGVIAFAGDVDSFTLDLDAGQTVTLLVSPTLPSDLRPMVDLVDPSQIVLASALAAAAGQCALLQTAAVSVAGTYVLRVRAADSTTGVYTVQATLNAALETEGLLADAGNDSRATAQDLAASFVTLPTALGEASRGAVAGTIKAPRGDCLREVEPNNLRATANDAAYNFAPFAGNVYHLGIQGRISYEDDADFYDIGLLDVGDVITISLSGSPSYRGSLSDSYLALERISADGNAIMITNTSGGPDTDSLIYRYRVTTAGSYRVAVDTIFGEATGSYALSLFLENTGAAPATGGTFTTEPESDDINDASTSWRAVQYLSRTAGEVSTGDADFYRYEFAAGDLVSVVVSSLSRLVARVNLRDAAGAIIASEDGKSSDGTGFFGGDSQVYAFRVPSTGVYFVEVQEAYYSGAYSADIYLSTDIAPAAPVPDLGDYYAFAARGGDSLALSLKALTAGGTLNVELQDGTGNILATGAGGATNLDQVLTWAAPGTGTYFARISGSDRTSYNLVITRGAAFDTEANDTAATAQDLGGTSGVLGHTQSGSAADEDWYAVTLGSEDTVLWAKTSTPGDGPGQFVNGLDPRVELYDAAGSTQIAGGTALPDGRNEGLRVTGLTPGATYTLKVSQEGDLAGEYFLGVATSSALTTSVGLDASGNLIVTDLDGGNSDDALTISRNGDNLRIHDPAHAFAAGPDTVQLGPYTVEVPLARVTGPWGIRVEPLAGNDTLTVDFSGGDPLPAGGLFFDGGGPSSAPGDRLIVVGNGGSRGSYAPDCLVPGSGVLSVDGSAIRFTGLEPVTVHGFAAFTFVTPNSNDLLIVDSPAAGQNRIRGTSGGLAFAPLMFFDVGYFEIDAAVNDGALGLAGDSVVFASDLVAAGLTSFTVLLGAGGDTASAAAVTSLGVTLNGGPGDDFLEGGTAGDELIGGPGEDTLIGRGGQDSYDGGDAFDAILIRGTAAKDVLQVLQTSASTLEHTVFSAAGGLVDGGTQVDTFSEIEQVLIEAGAGDDVVRVSVSDTLFDDPGASLRFNIDGGPAGTRDRLAVIDDGQDDLSIYRRGEGDQTGSISIGPANAEPFEFEFQNVEYAEILDESNRPISQANANGRLVVFPNDPFEANNDLLVATHLGAGAALGVAATIDAGAVSAGPPFGLTLPGDEDWYRFEAQVTGTLDVRVSFQQIGTLPNGRPGLPGEGNLDIVLYDAGGDSLAFRASTSDGERVRIPAVQGQVYYLRVFGVEDAINSYTLTASGAAPPTPFDLSLPAPSDSGRSPFDGVTNDNRPTILLRLDDAILLNDLPGNAAGTPGAMPPVGAIPILHNSSTAASPVGLAAGFRLAVYDETDTQGLVFLGFAQPEANANGVYSFTCTAPLAEGRHFISARVQMIDPADNNTDPQTRTPATGWGPRSQSLQITVDTVPPPVFFGVAGDASDGLAGDAGVVPQPDTFVDNSTHDRTPTFWGTAEADAVVRLWLDLTPDDGLDDYDVLLGQTVASPVDGSDAFSNGPWQVSSSVDLNDPALFRGDGLRRILVTAEDVAGNGNPGPGVPAQALEIFVDTQGPQVTRAFLTDAPNYALFDPQPSPDGPTPLAQRLSIRVQDWPARVGQFLDPALNPAVAVQPGHFQLVGDANGRIPIQAVTLSEDSAVVGQPATGTIVLTFFAPLADDRFTLTLSDAIVDDVGNALDGESNAAEPQENPLLPSGDGQPGGEFVARFTIDSRPELGVYQSGSVWVDTNGNLTFDPTNPDHTHRDITYMLDFTTNNLFAGNFSEPGPSAVADGFDKLAAYGRAGSNFRWLIDTDNDGVPNPPTGIVDSAGINGLPVAGDFDGNPRNGDEVGLLANNVWYFDINHDYQVDLPGITLDPTGLPIVGDFDGDGFDDLSTWKDGRFAFLLTAGVDRAWLPGGVDPVPASIDFGSIGASRKPVVADMDRDGIDDLGLWVPDRAGVSPGEQGEWYFLVSSDFDPAGDGLNLPDRVPGTLVTLAHPFQPRPFGSDLYASYGDEFALPVVGNFDPPVAGTTSLPVQIGATNLDNAHDVNGDAEVTPLDVLFLINQLNESGTGRVAAGSLSGGPYWDVTADGMLTPADVLAVVNYLNGHVSSTFGGEAEAAVSGQPGAESLRGVGSWVAVPTLSPAGWGSLTSVAIVDARSGRSPQTATAGVDRCFGQGEWKAEDRKLRMTLDRYVTELVNAISLAESGPHAAVAADDLAWLLYSKETPGRRLPSIHTGLADRLDD